MNDAAHSSTVLDSVAGANGVPVGGAYVHSDNLHLSDSAGPAAEGPYLSLPNNILGSSPSQISIEIWFSTKVNSDGACLFQFGASGSNFPSIYLSRSGSIFVMTSITAAGVSVEHFSGNGFDHNALRHVVLIWDVPNCLQHMYVSGNDGGSTTSCGVSIPSSTTANFIGNGIVSNGVGVAGYIAEFRIWNGVLTHAEVVSHKNAGPDQIAFPSPSPTTAPTPVPTAAPTPNPTSVPTSSPSLLCALVDTEWGVQTGSNVDDFVVGIAVDSDDNVFVSGDTSGSLFELNSGGKDYWVAKYCGSDGSLIWGLQAGTSSDEGSGGLAVDSSGDAFIIGSTSTNCWVAKRDGTDGSLLFDEQLGSGYLNGVAVDHSGDVFVGGYVTGAVYGTHLGSLDSWVAKRSGANGSPMWAVQGGTSDVDRTIALAVNSIRRCVRHRPYDWFLA